MTGLINRVKEFEVGLNVKQKELQSATAYPLGREYKADLMRISRFWIELALAYIVFVPVI